MTTADGNNSVNSGVSSRKQKLHWTPTSSIGTDNYVWYFQLKTKEYYQEHLYLQHQLHNLESNSLLRTLQAHAAHRVKGQRKFANRTSADYNLERLGQPVGQNLAVSLILVSLNKDFTSFVQNFNMHGMGKTVNELHAMLKLHEESLPKKDANPALHAIRAGRVQKNQKNKPHKAGRGGKGKGKNKMGYAHNNVPFAPKPKTSPPPKKDNPAKDAICHQCGEVGHWRRNCPVYLTELMKKKKLPQGASTSGIFTIELYSFPSKSWIYDTGCGTHICITTQGLRGSRKLKPGALSLYVGDGHRAAVEAIGTYHLELPSGLVIVLNNCHYAPSITRGVISVSRLFDDGFVNRFDDNNVISVSKDNLVYFMAVPRDGIFEIDIRYGYVYLLKHKHEVFETFKVFQKEVENQLEKTIKSPRSDRGGEYMSQEFLNHLKEHETIAHRTPPYTPQNNGVSERRNRTLLDMVRSMMSQTTLPKSFWDYALEAFSTWFQLRRLIRHHMKYGMGKPRSFFVARNAEFFESKLLDLKASGSVKDLELIQEEDTNPYLDTSLDHEEDDQEIDEPQSDINPIL
ncbi:zinc finger, CCHC-type containing protein, partial [Tanacetum coccineum]